MQSTVKMIDSGRREREASEKVGKERERGVGKVRERERGETGE